MMARRPDLIVTISKQKSAFASFRRSIFSRQCALFDSKYIVVFSRVDGNPRLCVNATSCPTGGKSSNVGIIVGVVVGVLVAVVIAVLVGICCCSKWRQVTVACPQYADPGKISIKFYLFNTLSMQYPDVHCILSVPDASPEVLGKDVLVIGPYMGATKNEIEEVMVPFYLQIKILFLTKLKIT